MAAAVPVTSDTIGEVFDNPGTVVCERQVGAQCGQHAINNLLQELKCIRVEADSNNDIVDINGVARSQVQLKNYKDVKINFRAICEMNDGYCLPPKTGTWYSDDALTYILQNKLEYRVESLQTFNRDNRARNEWINGLIVHLGRDNSLGCLLNQGNNHWTAIVKHIDNRPRCINKPYTYLNSMSPERIQCLNNAELRQFLTLKFRESDLRGYIVVFHRDGYSYISVSAARNLEARGRQFVLPTNLLSAAAPPAAGGAGAPVTALATAASAANGAGARRRTRLLELYAEYSGDSRKINALKKLEVSALPESVIMATLNDKGVEEFFVEAYLQSDKSISNVRKDLGLSLTNSNLANQLLAAVGLKRSSTTRPAPPDAPATAAPATAATTAPAAPPDPELAAAIAASLQNVPQTQAKQSWSNYISSKIPSKGNVYKKWSELSPLERSFLTLAGGIGLSYALTRKRGGSRKRKTRNRRRN